MSTDAQRGGASARREFVRCTFPDCKSEFPSYVAMIDHKISSVEHEYCPTCPNKDENGNDMVDENGDPVFGVDCKDWDDFIKHKVTSELHICCPVCGVEFKSQGGLKRHVMLSHPRDQSIICVGCNSKFTRAPDLMRHLEQGKCNNASEPDKSISKENFQDQVHKKAIVKHMFDHHNPELSFSSVASTQASGAGSNASVYRDRTANSKQVNGQTVHATSGSFLDNLSEDQGGVSLLDRAPEIIVNLPKPLKPKTSSNTPSYLRHDLLSDISVAGTRSNMSSNQSVVSTMSGMAIRDTLESMPRPSNASLAVSSASSARLFPTAQAGPGIPREAFQAGLRARDREYEQDHIALNGSIQPSVVTNAHNYHIQNAQNGGVNIFHHKFWDPERPEYSPEVFFNPVIDKYECPFPQCLHTTSTPKDLSDHLRTGHAIQQLRCPSCLKLFRTATSVVAHMTSASLKCDIRNTRDFDRVLDRMSGGFLAVEKTQVHRDFGTGELVERKPDPEGAGLPGVNGARHELAKTLRKDDVVYSAGQHKEMW